MDQKQALLDFYAKADPKKEEAAISKIFDKYHAAGRVDDLFAKLGKKLVAPQFSLLSPSCAFSVRLVDFSSFARMWCILVDMVFSLSMNQCRGLSLLFRNPSCKLSAGIATLWPSLKVAV